MLRELKECGCCDNLEARFKKKDGSLTTALKSARVILLNNELHIISITRDIAERKIAEAERKRLLVVLDQANEIVIITDAAGTIQYVNPAFDGVRQHGSESILPVDDELSIVRLEKQVLERLGYRVAERTGSVDALHAFRANPDRFDLVI